MRDDTTLAVPAPGMPGDGLGALVRMAVRGAIEAAVERELTLTLGRGSSERATAAVGDRHGTIPRTVVTGAGPVALTVPRARRQPPAGPLRSGAARCCPGTRAGRWRSIRRGPSCA